MNELDTSLKFKNENHLDKNISKWFAIYTHYKREKMTSSYLSNMGIQTYLPIKTYIRRYTRKTKEVQLPLINNYVFVKITKKEYVKVLQCPYVLKFVTFSKNLISIPEQEIDLIKLIIGETNTVEIGNLSFEPGNAVEVIGGELTGLKGLLIEKENNQFLRVKLTNIGISLNISIAANLLRKINTDVLT